jgi:hypothetical protein
MRQHSAQVRADAFELLRALLSRAETLIDRKESRVLQQLPTSHRTWAYWLCELTEAYEYQSSYETRGKGNSKAKRVA